MLNVYRPWNQAATFRTFGHGPFFRYGPFFRHGKVLVMRIAYAKSY